ncbi:uncharacterized protein M421DRAFT_62952, partial [Didymella exigua CBS 183.55]
NVLYHRAGHITEPVKICQDQHNSALHSMSQQHHDLLLQHKGRLQLALQAYNTRQFQSHWAAAAAFNVNQRRLSERASNTPF